MRLLASFFLLAFTTVVTVGCGSSDDFVATNGFAPASNTGDLVFRTFTLAAAQTIEVPAATTDLDFEFFDAANNSVFTYTQGFAPEVIVKNVPTSAKRVVITARGPNGPLATIEANVTVTPGGQTVVDLSGATITLLGQLIVEPETLQFAPGGLLGAVDDFAALLANGESLENLAFFRVYFAQPGSSELVDVTARVGVHFENFFPASVTADSFTYFNLAGEGIGLTTNPLGPTAPFGATCNMVVTYILEGQVYTDSVKVTLDNPQLIGVDVPVAKDGTLNLPATGVTNFPVLAFATYSNGFRLPILNGTSFIPPFPGADTFVMSHAAGGPAGFVADADGIDTGGTTGTGVVNITANGETTPIASFNVNLVNANSVTEAALTVASTDINPSGRYIVTVTYNDGTTQDLTGVWPGAALLPLFPPAINDDNGSGDSNLVYGAFGGILPEGGRLGGAFKGTTTLSIGTQVDVAAFLNFLGFTTAADGDLSNNSVELNVLSTVPLGSALGILFP